MVPGPAWVGKMKRATLEVAQPALKPGSRRPENSNFPDRLPRGFARLLLDSRGERSGGYKSFGVKPVRFAMRASIFGPLSSSSWNEKTTSFQFARLSVRCEPELSLQLPANLDEGG